MPQLQTATRPAATSTPTGAAPQDTLQDPLLKSGKRDKVVAYLTQNSTTHHVDEIPEALSALKANDAAGLGKKKLLPISDPYADGHSTYGGTLGADAAKKLTWWHDDPSLQEGQVRLGDRVFTLGTPDAAQAAPELKKAIGNDWKDLMAAIGMKPDSVQAVQKSMFTDAQGQPKLPDSGVGAVNELLQLTRTFDRANQGEFDLDTLVMSGHHYQGTSYLFGEKGDHEYDLNDSLDVRDVGALAKAFPTAAGQVQNVQFSACNTHDLGLTDASGQSQSTNDWLQQTFPNVQRGSYWKGIAAGATTAALHGGEFLADAAKAQNGNTAAFHDATWRKNQGKGEMQRSSKGADGKLAESFPTGTSSSYTTNIGGQRGKNTPFHKRADLAPYLLK